MGTSGDASIHPSEERDSNSKYGCVNSKQAAFSPIAGYAIASNHRFMHVHANTAGISTTPRAKDTSIAETKVCILSSHHIWPSPPFAKKKKIKGSIAHFPCRSADHAFAIHHPCFIWGFLSNIVSHHGRHHGRVRIQHPISEKEKKRKKKKCVFHHHRRRR